MPFYPWFPRDRVFDPLVWQAAVETHARWLERLNELAPAAVLGSRPIELGGRRLNEGFLLNSEQGYRPVHAKYYLPDEDGFWEASWYRRGPQEFKPVEEAGISIGVLICSELWFMERARAYGRRGIHILANPRGTLHSTREKWLVGGRAAAIVSGAFCLSSNRSGPARGKPIYGGQGWAIDPDGEVLGVTSPDRPFLTVELDLQGAEQAKGTYPRYISE
jgi:N-carbamoylputrescine amidase